MIDDPGQARRGLELHTVVFVSFIKFLKRYLLKILKRYSSGFRPLINSCSCFSVLTRFLQWYSRYAPPREIGKRNILVKTGRRAPKKVIVAAPKKNYLRCRGTPGKTLYYLRCRAAPKKVIPSKMPRSAEKKSYHQKCRAAPEQKEKQLPGQFSRGGTLRGGR